jgi:hypothetical protein
MHTRNTMDAIYSDRGTEVARKSQIMKRGKVIQEMYLVNTDYLDGELGAHVHPLGTSKASRTIKNRMRRILDRGDCVDRTGEVLLTCLAETTADELDHPEWLDERDNPLWVYAMDVAMEREGADSELGDVRVTRDVDAKGRVREEHIYPYEDGEVLLFVRETSRGGPAQFLVQVEPDIGHYREFKGGEPSLSRARAAGHRIAMRAIN